MIQTESASTETSADVVRVGDRLPAVLGPTQLRRVLGMGRSQFFKAQAAGKLKRFEFKRAIGVKRYSGRLVQAYLDSRE